MAADHRIPDPWNADKHVLSADCPCEPLVNHYLLEKRPKRSKRKPERDEAEQGCETIKGVRISQARLPEET